jgi:hypothetical protein
LQSILAGTFWKQTTLASEIFTVREEKTPAFAIENPVHLQDFPGTALGALLASGVLSAPLEFQFRASGPETGSFRLARRGTSETRGGEKQK